MVPASGRPGGGQPQASLCCHADTGEVTPAPSPAQPRCRHVVRGGLVATYLLCAERCVNIVHELSAEFICDWLSAVMCCDCWWLFLVKSRRVKRGGRLISEEGSSQAWQLTATFKARRLSVTFVAWLLTSTFIAW